MPVPIPRDAPLTPLLSNRLQASLAAHESGEVCRSLNNLLTTVWNVPPVTSTAPPTQQDSESLVAKAYRHLVAPMEGTQSGPFSKHEQRTVELLHYLEEVRSVPPLDVDGNPATALPQSHVHANLLHEVRREFRLLHCSFPRNWGELAANDIAARVLVGAQQQGFQPTEVRTIAAQELPPEAGCHQGGVSLTVVAWNGATPPGPAATSSDPNVWDPNNPLGNGPDLQRAPLQLDWTGAVPLSW